MSQTVKIGFVEHSITINRSRIIFSVLASQLKQFVYSYLLYLSLGHKGSERIPKEGKEIALVKIKLQACIIWCTNDCPPDIAAGDLPRC